jgi:hypothetical protein
MVDVPGQWFARTDILITIALVDISRTGIMMMRPPRNF